MRALIIGGGIGGVTAAIALRRAGIDVRLFERAREPREVGAGIALWANALKALRAIEADQAVLAAGERCIAAEIRTSAGRVLKQTPVEVLDRTAGAPMVLVHRAELLATLLGLLPAEAVSFGRQCVGIRQSTGEITAKFRDDSTATGDVLIGADGINSVVRTALFGGGRPRYSGYTCWRAVAEFPIDRVAPGSVAEVWGRGDRFGITRIGRGRLYWWATANAPEGGRDTDARAALRERFRAYADPVPAIIEATPAPNIIRNDIVDRPPARPWGRGRAVLIGDAAHPTTPNLGQGGCMAIEDGVVLARLLSGASDVPAALREFERRRFPRCAMITNRSWSFGRWGQATRPLACRLRNAGAALVPDALMLRSYRAMVAFE